jgi:competence protein ComEA
MLKKLLVILAMMYAAVAFAAVDVNKATAAELDGIKGIGPGISTKILDERKKGAFKDWNDLITRVNGIGETNAAKFSAEGMTVGGSTFKGVAAAPTKKEEKPMAKDAAGKPAATTAAAPAKDAKAADAKPVAAAAPAAATAPAAAKEDKKDPKAEAKMKADEEKKAKAEAKAKAAEEKKAKAEADKKAKAEPKKDEKAAAAASKDAKK